MRRRAGALGGLLALTVALTACAPEPVENLTLPGGVATGDDGYTVTAYFQNTQNLVPNAQVLYNNKQIGTVRSIDFHTGADKRWEAKLTFSVLKNRPLPADIKLKIGQKSLLGAEYLEVDVPTTRTLSSRGTLEEHKDEPISTARTGNYPETEQVLAGVALLLGNGGLGQIRTITSEVNKLFSGKQRQTAARDLIKQLNGFFGTLDSQKNEIVDLIASVDRLGKVLADQRVTLARGIDHIDPGLKLLAEQRSNLTKALQSIARFSVAGKKLINESGDALVNNLSSLQPVLRALNETGNNLPESLLELGVFPFPTRTAPNALKGDYGNLFATLNLTLPELIKDFGGVDLAKIGQGNALKLLTSSQATQSGNPVTDPVGLPKPTGRSTTPSSGDGANSTPTTSEAGTATGTPTAPSPSPSSSCGLLPSLLGGC